MDDRPRQGPDSASVLAVRRSRAQVELVTVGQVRGLGGRRVPEPGLRVVGLARGQRIAERAGIEVDDVVEEVLRQGSVALAAEAARALRLHALRRRLDAQEARRA